MLEGATDAPGLSRAIEPRLAAAFDRGSGPGLLQLGAGEAGHLLPPALAWWCGFAGRYVAALCLHPPSPGSLPDVPPTDSADLASLVLTGPKSRGPE